VYLADQKLPVQVPRVRDVAARREVPLRAYQALQTPRQLDEGLLRRVMKGLATRSYAACSDSLPEAFGVSRSAVSRRYVQATARKLAAFQERSLDGYDLVAVFFDGKAFADEEIILALGVTLNGDKVPLGFVQAATENERVCRQFLNDLVQRGLQYGAGLLVVLDGGKGLHKAVTTVLAGHACVQRCQYHKRGNVESYLAKSEQARIRRKLEAAYGQPTYEGAKAALEALKPELKLMNESALRSLEEGFEETLTLHRLGLMPMLKAFRTTNCIENVNSLLAQLTRNVRRWTNSSQRHRWVAAALLDIEPRLRKINGYQHLQTLRNVLQAELGIRQQQLAQAG
jgi:transposase-like protein